MSERLNVGDRVILLEDCPEHFLKKGEVFYIVCSDKNWSEKKLLPSVSLSRKFFEWHLLLKPEVTFDYSYHWVEEKKVSLFKEPSKLMEWV